MTYRTRIFLGVFVATSIALAVSTFLVERVVREHMSADVGRGLLTEARLAAALLTGRPAAADLDLEADRLGALTGTRVTFVGADGTVLGDSEVDSRQLATIENHADRAEIRLASQRGEGRDERLSHTTGEPTMYAAVAVRDSPVGFVRVAMPLRAVAAQVAGVRRVALIGLVAGLAVALGLAAVASQRLHRRVRAVADTALRYRQGDFSQPARDPAPDEIGLVAGVLDDTARELGARLAEMGRERAHMDAILSGMAEGVILVNNAGRLVLTNPAVRTMLRLPTAAEGVHYLEVVRQPDIAAQVAQALAGREPAAVDVQLDRDTRRVFVARVVPLPREREGGAVLVLHDITDLRRADQVRRDFVANVSHELRTPLTAIRGYVEALLDAPPSPAETQRFLEIIARHTLRMERLVRDLLRLARLDAGQETLERADCSVASLVAAVEHELQSQLDARHQRVSLSIAPDAATVSGDPAKLHDVLRNLLENAGHYSPDGGTIDVTSRRTTGGVEITVADRGTGIPEHELGRIFERFYRVDRSRTRDPGGTGLGLSIVKHLVELHGGKVAARNREGGGAAVSFVVP